MPTQDSQPKLDAAAAKKGGVGRLAFIDWTRGLAAVIMLQGHTFNSFTRTDLRPQGPYMLSQFAGGLPPAIFLLLTGITFAFLMDSQSKQLQPPAARLWAAVKRSRYLFILAFLFRLQMFVTGYPTSPASEILRVDILNCMGFAMLVFSPFALATTLVRARMAALAGAAVAALAPIMSMVDTHAWPSVLRAYIFPDFNFFGFFPWASFLAFGLSLGSILRLVKKEDMQIVMLWLLGIGVGTGIFAYYLSNIPYSLYPKSDFWLNSPAQITIKLSFVLCMLSLAYVWVHAGNVQGWSLFRQVGTTSLLVYWVHIELVYGRWFGAWKESLTVFEVLIYTVVLTAFMALLSVLWTRHKSKLSGLRWPKAQAQALSSPQAVPAD